MQSPIFKTSDRDDHKRVYFAEVPISSMKKSEPKEALGSRLSKSKSLDEQYFELLKLREEVSKLTSSRINPRHH
jgi:hypothetical protein